MVPDEVSFGDVRAAVESASEDEIGLGCQIPAAAIDAATEAISAEPNFGRTTALRILAQKALEAAGPAIRAAEREACIAEIFTYADNVLADGIGAIYRDAARVLTR